MQGKKVISLSDMDYANDETADWQTYKNEEYGFEMKYPEDWNLLKDDLNKKFNAKKDNCNFSMELYPTGIYDRIIKNAKTSNCSINESSVNGIAAAKIGCNAKWDYSYQGYWIYTAKTYTGFFRIFPFDEGRFYLKPGEPEPENFIDCTITFNQILSTFKFTEKDENIVSNSKKFITEYKIDSKTGARVEIVSPDTMERNKKNEVKITISDWDKYGLDLHQSFLSVMNITDYRLGDKVYSNCKESNGQEECLVSVTPLCKWPDNIILSPIIHITIFQPVNADHILDFPNNEVKILTLAAEICDNKIDDDCDGKIDGLDSQCASFIIYVLPGEGITNLARRAIAQYLEKFYNDAYLNKEGKIYAEDYIKRDLKDKIGPLKTGERIDFPVSLIEQAIMKAKALSFQETVSLGKYKELINYGGYRFVSKTSSVTDSEKVWEMDENTKKQLIEVKRFATDEGKAWKVVDNTGSIIIYYENKDIDKILYLIGAYRENIMAQDYSFMESLFTHSVEISSDGINWEKGKVVYDNFYDKNNSSATKDGMGVGSFYLNVKDYNNSRLYVKFNLASYSYGTAITLSKNIRTNIKNSTFKFIEEDETVNKTIKEEFLTSRDNFDYKLETFGDYSKQNIDQRLVKINKTKKREILIPSIKETLPELKKINLLLSKFAVPSNSDKIFLKSVLMDTDNPGGVIYSYNLSTSEFEKLKINDVYNGFFGGFALSPDQTKFIWIPQPSENGDDKEMYLIDLAGDEYKILIKLKDKETFNGGKGAMLSHQFVEWLDNSKIRYAVYDQTKKSASYYNLDYDFQESIDKILIENREIAIEQ